MSNFSCLFLSFFNFGLIGGQFIFFMANFIVGRDTTLQVFQMFLCKFITDTKSFGGNWILKACDTRYWVSGGGVWQISREWEILSVYNANLLRKNIIDVVADNFVGVTVRYFELRVSNWSGSILKVIGYQKLVIQDNQ